MLRPSDIRSPAATPRGFGAASVPSQAATLAPDLAPDLAPSSAPTLSYADARSIDLDAGLCLNPASAPSRLAQLLHILLLLAIACLPACAEQEHPSAGRASPRPIQTITLTSPGSVTPSTAPVDDSEVVIIPNASGRVVVSNSRCPIMPEHTIKPTGVFTDQVAVFRGQLIGFCCADCRDAWKSMSDAERTEALTTAANFK